MTSEQCAGRPGFAFRCDRKASVEHDGKCYCWQHDPQRLSRIAAEKRAERMAHHKRIEGEIDAKHKRQRLLAESGIAALTDDDLASIIVLGGIKEMMAKPSL